MGNDIVSLNFSPTGDDMVRTMGIESSSKCSGNLMLKCILYSDNVSVISTGKFE